MRPRLTLLIVVVLSALAGLSGCSNLPLWMVGQQRSQITDHQHFAATALPAAARPLPLPDAAQPLALPPDPVSGEPMEALLARQGTVALVVLRHGAVVYERYFNGRDRQTLLTSFSMAKSVVATLLGLAIRDGRIASVDDPVTRYLPELAQQDPRFADVRLHHLLAMRSGIAFDERYNVPWSDAAVFYLTPDLRRAVSRMTVVEPPDQRYRYSSGDTQLLGMVIERATGQSLGAWMDRQLWQPMGAAQDGSWSLDSALQGQAKAFCCWNARALDYARFGQLMLQRGRVGERQVVPTAWIDAMLQVRAHPGTDAAARRNIESPGTPQAVFYTWQWRRPTNAVPTATPAVDAAPDPLHMVPSEDFYAQGQHGQYIYVAPQQGTVIVRIGTDRRPDLWWPGLLGRIARSGLPDSAH
jgi:CubicO group peptidase (beta-lactamase class C family)